MSEITASKVKELRETTGAGMMDCKKALTETNGDMEAAIDWLRKKGLAAAAKKSGRAAAEGLVAICVKDDGGCLVEVNAETDFVGRNEKFQEFALKLADLALEVDGDVEKLKGMKYPGTSHTVEEELSNLIAVIGENMSLRRTDTVKAKKGVVASYMHSSTAPNLGRIGVLVALESDAGDKAALSALAKEIAMHIAASNPSVISLDEITQDQRARERDVLKDQVRVKLQKIEQYIYGNMLPQVEGRLSAKEINKAQFESQSKALAKRLREEIKDKEALDIARIAEIALEEAVLLETVDADFEKYLKEMALLEQPFVINPKKTLNQVLSDATGKFGTPVSVGQFIRMALGEGIEKKEENFAEEVKAQLGS